MTPLPPRHRLGFILASVVVAMLSLWIAVVPINILYGKIPEPPFDLVMNVVLKRTLPILIASAMMIWLAQYLLVARRVVWAAALLLLVAPLASLALLFLSADWL